ARRAAHAVRRQADVLGRVQAASEHPRESDRGRLTARRFHVPNQGDRTMTDVRDAPATANENRPATGGYIWYELMTPDPEGSKAFYDAVVGWNIGDAAPEFKGYRMIGRSDGGFAGGILPLTDEMQQHGARPIW